MADVKKTVQKTLQEAAYVAVGVGVLGFQRAQVRRQEVRKQLAARRDELGTQVETYVGEYRTKLAELAGRVEPVVKELEQRIEPVLDDIEGRLPGQAKELVQQVRRTIRRPEAGTAAA